MAQLYSFQQGVKQFPRTFLRGIGQVMFQDSMWTGILFLAGIIWGAYAEGQGTVAWGVVVGTVVSTLTGYILQLPDENGANGLWGFNGCLVGAAFPTFMGDTIWMWSALVLCSAFSVWLRSGMDNILGRWNMSSFTFPFVLSTYFFLLSSRLFANMPPEFMGSPEFPTLASGGHLDLGFGNLVIYWLKGISQVFLINSWVTGIFFLAGLAVSNLRAAIWAAISSALALLVVCLYKGPANNIAEGLYGFSAVLTGIALGATYCNNSWKTWIWTLLGIIMTVFVQAAMNAFFLPMGLPTLTGPFCVATWMFLFPNYSFFLPKKNSPQPPLKTISDK